MIGTHVGRNIKRKEEKMEGENLYSYSSAMLFSSLFPSGTLGFGEGVSAMTIFSESSAGELSLGLLISIGAGLQITNIETISHNIKTKILWL